MNRESLPFRKNCEGYLILKDGSILVRDTGKGFLEFPGGGVDEGESPSQAIQREAKEETGAILVPNSLKQIKVMRLLWSPDWAKTEKQKMRYQKFKGEEMYFFTAKVQKLVVPQGDSAESGWHGQRTMKISETIKKLESFKPFPEEMKGYREFQLSTLKFFLN